MRFPKKLANWPQLSQEYPSIARRVKVPHGSRRIKVRLDNSIQCRVTNCNVALDYRDDNMPFRDVP